MSPRIDTDQVFYEPEVAEAKAAALREDDPDWAYNVVYSDNAQWAKIEVYDEDGFLVGTI